MGEEQTNKNENKTATVKQSMVTTDVLGVGDCVNEFQIYDFDCLDFLPDTGCTK